MLLVGPPGSRKTSFGLHFLSQCGPNQPGLFFGFYEAPAGVRAKAAALGLAVAGLLDSGDVALNWQPTTDALLDETCAHLIENIRLIGARRGVRNTIRPFGAQPWRTAGGVQEPVAG